MIKIVIKDVMKGNKPREGVSFYQVFIQAYTKSTLILINQYLIRTTSFESSS
jgi:hypothetical protein